MSNIEEMEKIFNELISSYGNKSYFRNRITDFMSYCIDQHKDHLDKIVQLEQQIAELIKTNDKELLNENGDYPYEPNGDYPKYNE